MPGLSTTEQVTNAAKELIQVLKNPGPQTPFTIREIQLHSIDRLEKLFNTMQPEKTHTKVLLREVPKRTPLRVPITVAPPRVPVTVAPLTAMTPMLPMISKEYPVENSRKRDKLKKTNNNN